MNPRSAGSSSGCGSGLHTSTPLRSSNEEAAQLRAAVQASSADVGRLPTGEAADEADSDLLQLVVTDAAASASLQSAVGLKELVQHGTAIDIQSPHSTNAEPDITLANEAGMTTPHSEHSDEHYIPWLLAKGKWGKLPKILYLLFLVSVLLTSLGFIYAWLMLLLDGFFKFLGKYYYLATFYFSFRLLLSTQEILLWLPISLVLYLVLFVDIRVPRSRFLGERTLYAAGPSARRITYAMAIVFGASMTILLSWLLFELMPTEFTIQSWPAFSLPRSYSGCDARVSHEQSPLFTPEMYHNQFSGLMLYSANRSETAVQSFMVSQVGSVLYESVRTSKKLCGHGFEANTDLYGLGFRVGVYFAVDLVATRKQWFTSRN
jgi:hypothetical protein